MVAALPVKVSGQKAPAPPGTAKNGRGLAARLGQPDLCTRTHIRCPSAGKASSATLVEIADLVDEYLPKLKALEGAVVNRAVCGGCLDFKLATTVAARDRFERAFSLNKAQSGGRQY